MHAWWSELRWRHFHGSRIICYPVHATTCYEDITWADVGYWSKIIY